jgi:glycosyltransferase involved in cell wall biosynthesis
MKKLLIIANNNIGQGQSGGDTIFLNFIKYWQKDLNITVLGSQETKDLLKRYQLQKIKFIKTDDETNLPLLFHQIRRIIKSIKSIYKLRTKHYDLIYTVSDFYPDLIPGLIYKAYKHQSKLICGYYLFAPNPFDSQSPYIQTDQFFKGLFYYLSQLPSRLAVNLWADIVMVTSNPDIQKFPNKKVIVVQGGVDKAPKIKSRKIYDAVFLGRLHPQKGPLELIDIWKYVVKQKPKAKLALIGDGGLEKRIKTKIKKNKLEKNITMFGFKTGIEKYKIFSQSKVALHPAIYDSGGMAMAEALSTGIPGVSFDLEALKTYYPKGVLKTKCFNKRQFAKNIIKLLDDKKLYKQYATTALSLINSVWLWPKRAKRIYKEIISN